MEETSSAITTFATREMITENPDFSGQMDPSDRAIMAAVFILEAVTGIFGNCLVIVAVVFSRKLQTSTNVYVVTLAVVDLFTSCTQVVQATVLLSSERSRSLIAMCQVIGAATINLLGYSLGTLTLIAVHRLQVITKNARNRSHIRLKIAGSVFAMFSFLTIVLVTLGKVTTVEFGLLLGGYCSYSVGVYLDLTTAVILVMFLSIIVVCYFKMYQHVRQHLRQVSHIHGKPEAQTKSTSEATEKVNSSTSNAAELGDHGKRNSVADSKPAPTQQYCTDTKESKDRSTKESEPTKGENTKSSNAETSTAQYASTSDPPTQSQAPPNSVEGSKAPIATSAPQTDQEKVGPAAAHPAGTTASADDPKASQKKSARNKAESKITLNMFIMVVTFVLCIVPTMAMLFVPGSQNFGWIPFLILNSNSCWNPLIYAWKHPDFKQTFRCMLTFKFSAIEEPAAWLRERLRKDKGR